MTITRWIGTAALLAACSKAPDSKQPPPDPNPKPVAPIDAAAPAASSGWYRAVIGEKQGTAIPVFLQLPAGGTEALIATGPDRVHAKLVSGPPKVVIAFEVLRTQIEATAQPSGALDGTWDSKSGSWGSASLSFHAEPIPGPDPDKRFPSAPGPDPSGVWKLQLTKPEELAKLTIHKGSAPNELTATIGFQTGNLAFLAGNQEGKTIRLSAFDGASPYLIVAEIDEAAKQLKGNWTAGQALAWKETLTGQKTNDFVLEQQMQLSKARPKLKVAQLAKPPYAGNPVIVELGGSWCPACGHASAKLKALKDKYAAEGLQVLTLAYEFTDDAAYNKQQAEVFKTKYQIPWDVIPVDGGIEKYNEIIPEGIEQIDPSGFPITIFVARDGTIEGFHSGFPPENWGELHKQTLEDFDRLTAKIVASKKSK
ncbi:MAG TPA: TlpA disulfide reductase family protein [Kofleriaceae bacterium]|nr:TlpA disulfide reductase family protein [Kofleriaceae bacterium]